MNAPLVSVILPTFNRAQLLPRAISSVLGQTFGDFELIIVDDGSTDATNEMVRSFEDPRIVFIRSERNLGDAGARNRGAAVASGDWLAFQDSDDEWVPDKLERQLSFAAAYPKAAIVAASSIRVTGASVRTHRWPLHVDSPERGGVLDMFQWTRTGIANLQTMLVRRDTFEVLQGFDTGFRAIADSDFVFRLLRKAPHALVASHDIVAILYETSGSLTGNPDKIAHDLERLLDRHGDFLSAYPQALGELRYRLALTQLLKNDLSGSRRSALQAIAARPAYWRPWVYFVVSLFGLAIARRVREARNPAPKPGGAS